MRIGRSTAVVAAVAALMLTASTAQADPVKCRRAITKANGQYFAAIQKLIDKCKIGVITKGVPASLANCTIPQIDAGFAVGKVTAARTKAAATIAGACGGADKTCGTADGDDNLASINWPGTCPNFENAVNPQCNNAIPNCGGIDDCLTCISDKALEQLENGLLYDRFDAANFQPTVEPQKTRNKCQVTIAKATGKFVQAKTKTLNKCWDAKANDPTGAKGFGGPADGQQCPDTDPQGKATTAIISAEQKKIAAICKACGAGGDADKNRLCDSPGTAFALSEIIEPSSLPFDCPDVIVPATDVTNGMTEDCGAITVTNLQTYIDCIDCVAEFKVDCTTDAGQGTGNAGEGIQYAGECNPAPSTCNNGMLDAGEDCDPPGSTAQCIALGAGNGNEVCNASCKCPCPNVVTFRADPLSANSDLDAGWTGISHDSKVVSNGDITVDLTCGGDNSRPCGTCNFTGPIVNPGAGAGRLNSRRCRNDSSVLCTMAGQCPGAGNACVFWFGAPLPLSAGGVTTCVTNEFNGSVTGTANVESGESASVANLSSRVYNGIAVDAPCPKCTDAGGINDGVTGGTCTGGARNGLACDANSQSPVPSFGRTSLDCPPVAAGQIATLPIALKNSTDAESRSLSAASPFCTAFGSGTQKCPCDTCNNLASTPCASNADCTAVGATICGGLRCLADSPTPGVPCTSEGTGTDPLCGTTGGTCPAGTCVGGVDPGSMCDIGMDDQCNATCGRPGEATRPNSCSNGQCIAGGGPDDGQCQLAPTDNLCAIEQFRGCTANSDCPALGDTCTTKRRECLFNLDDLPVTNTGTITVNGMEDLPMNDDSTPTLASLFCVGPTGSSAVNNVAGLPGLGKLKLSGSAEGLP